MKQLDLKLSLTRSFLLEMNRLVANPKFSLSY